jgi:hypothetical protein
VGLADRIRLHLLSEEDGVLLVAAGHGVARVFSEEYVLAELLA